MHPHNSWIYVTMNLGLIGLLFALYFGYLMIKYGIKILITDFKKTNLFQKIVVILSGVLFVSTMVEVYIFTGYFHYFNFIFFLGLGYMIKWGKSKEYDS